MLDAAVSIVEDTCETESPIQLCHEKAVKIPDFNEAKYHPFVLYSRIAREGRVQNEYEDQRSLFENALTKY